MKSISSFIFLLCCNSFIISSGSQDVRRANYCTRMCQAVLKLFTGSTSGERGVSSDATSRGEYSAAYRAPGAALPRAQATQAYEAEVLGQSPDDGFTYIPTFEHPAISRALLEATRACLLSREAGAGNEGGHREAAARNEVRDRGAYVRRRGCYDMD